MIYMLYILCITYINLNVFVNFIIPIENIDQMYELHYTRIEFIH
jgi:hypothetical protein